MQVSGTRRDEVTMTRITRSGTYVLDNSVETVFRILTDPEQMVRCLPDTSEIMEQSGSTVRAVVKTGTNTVSIQLELSVTLEAANQETWDIRYVGHGSGPRSHVSFSGTFHLRNLDNGTEVEWNGELVVRGLLVALGAQAGQIEPIIDEKIMTTIENVQTQVMTDV